MRPDFWRDVEAAFAAVMRLPPDMRGGWLATEYGDRPDVVAEVESLMASHDRAGDFLGTRHLGAAPRGQARAPREVIAGFRLLAPVGRGGMGAVYRAERAAGEFTQQVAVKIVDAAMHSDEARRRFLAERQILAGLTHPHIVTLLDGGFAEHGEAYLVMEYVEGQTITRYCAERRLPIGARLQLVRQVCAGVHFAHQRGVVHRDLKPGNILVTPDGLPKILDFGVAKLIDPGVRDVDETATSLRGALTPDYASPEQLRGLAVTTASDIYSLGVLLYEIVAGRRPYDIAALPLDRALDVVLDGRHARPSVAAIGAGLPYSARRLRGEVDAIVAKAMRVEPEQRYASAQELGADLDRALAGEPVLARAPSLAYTMRALARRHRSAFVGAAVGVVALGAALVVSIEQRRLAVTERVRADARFNDVRRLATALVFDIHDAAAALPGSTDLRRRIVAEALIYLERLSADPGADPGLLHELGRGYARVGIVQGRPNTANLGDRSGAAQSLTRAIDVLARLAEGPAAAPAVLRDLVEARVALADVVRVDGRRDEALALMRAAVETAETLVAQDPAASNRQALGSALFTTALLLPLDESLPVWERALEVYGALLTEAPDDQNRQRNVALVHRQIGSVYSGRRMAQQSREHYVRALEINERRLARRPHDRGSMFDVAIDLSNLAHWSAGEGDLAQAAALYERSLALRQALVDGDPKDVQARGRLAYVHGELADIYVRLSRADSALRQGRAAVRLAEELATMDAFHRVELARALFRLGSAQRAADEADEACGSFRRAERLTQEVAKTEPGANEVVRGYVEQGLVTALKACG